jgi:hypothetical protein
MPSIFLEQKTSGDILYSFCQEKKQEKIKSLKTSEARVSGLEC